MKPSALGNIANFTIGDTITIPITKYNSGYSDTLNIYVGSTWIKRVEKLVNNQVITFTTEERRACYNAMPYVTAASFRFVNTTYNGATIVGTSEKEAKGTIPDSVKPTITNVEMREYVTGIAAKFGGYVQYRSQIYCNVTATAGTGTGIYGYSGNIGSSVVMDNPRITYYLDKSGTNNYSLTVTDQRYRTATTTGTFEVLEYDNPKINSFSVERCNQDGTPNLYGNYVKLNASAEVSSVNNKNDKSFKIQYKIRSASEWKDLLSYNAGYTYTVNDSIHSGFSVDNVYDFRIVVSDYFETIERNLNISAGFAIIDLNGSGKGIAFGKVSTKNALETGFEIYDRHDTVIRNGLAFYETNGSTDVNTTIEELVLSSTNTPDTSLWYVRTIFYATKSATANRIQVAYPYNKISPSYYRLYVNGGWSEWKSSEIKDMVIEDTSGYVWFASGFLIQWGAVSITPTSANVVAQTTIYFNKTYDSLPIVSAVPKTNVPHVISSGVGQGSTASAGLYSVVIYLNRTNTVATNFLWTAMGYKA